MRIFDVELPTADLDAQREFYGEALGLDVLDARDDRVTVAAGRTRLTFVAVPGDPGSQHFAFNVPENRIEDAADWLAERAPLIPGPRGERVLDFSGWNSDAVYCLDPARNVVELIARHSLSNASDEPFGPHALIEISEVGVPVDDIPATVGYLEGEVGIPLWDGDRRGFTALGDDHGLFIVVPRGRNWFPSDHPATTPPLRIGYAAASRGSRREMTFETPSSPIETP